MSNGKGDTRRPASVPQEKFAEKWERAFGTNMRDDTLKKFEKAVLQAFGTPAAKRKHAHPPNRGGCMSELVWVLVGAGVMGILLYLRDFG